MEEVRVPRIDVVTGTCYQTGAGADPSYLAMAATTTVPVVEQKACSQK